MARNLRSTSPSKNTLPFMSNKKRKQAGPDEEGLICSKCGKDYEAAVPDWCCNTCVQAHSICHECSPPVDICQSCSYPLCQRHKIIHQNLTFCIPSPTGAKNSCFVNGPRVPSSINTDKFLGKLKIYVNGQVDGYSFSDIRRKNMIWMMCRLPLVSDLTKEAIPLFNTTKEVYSDCDLTNICALRRTLV